MEAHAKISMMMLCDTPLSNLLKKRNSSLIPLGDILLDSRPDVLGASNCGAVPPVGKQHHQRH